VSNKSSFRERLERREPTPAKSLGRSDSPAVRLMLLAGNIRQPVEVARLFRKYGLSLRKAHDALNRLAKRETVAAEFYADDPNQLLSDLSSSGVNAYRIQVPDVDVKQVRDRLGISQAEFALRFGLELDTVQNWEQSRNIPDQSTRLLLKIIDSCPAVVESVLTGCSPLKPEAIAVNTIFATDRLAQPSMAHSVVSEEISKWKKYHETTRSEMLKEQSLKEPCKFASRSAKPSFTGKFHSKDWRVLRNKRAVEHRIVPRSQTSPPRSKKILGAAELYGLWKMVGGHND
jgi:DNA-binding transcriptional regulator YiaG